MYELHSLGLIWALIAHLKVEKAGRGRKELSKQEMRATIHSRRERQKRFVLFHHMFQDGTLDYYLLFPVIFM